LPLGILIGLQVGFLAYHDEGILFLQQAVITATSSFWQSSGPLFLLQMVMVSGGLNRP